MDLKNLLIKNIVMQKNKNYCMELAFEQAKIGLLRGEFPVGAVLVDSSGLIISQSYNMTSKGDFFHAEMIVLQDAKEYKNLKNCQLYVTLEPCIMCFGASVLQAVSKIEYAVSCEKFGSIAYMNALQWPLQSCYNSRMPLCIKTTFFEEEIKKMMNDFFVNKSFHEKK